MISLKKNVLAFTAKIFAENTATYNMVSSHLTRQGVSSSPIFEEELASTLNWENIILIIDYDSDRFTTELNRKLNSINSLARIVLTPLNRNTPPSIFSNWATLTKPVTSIALRESLVEILDSTQSIRGAGTLNNKDTKPSKHPNSRRRRSSKPIKLLSLKCYNC